MDDARGSFATRHSNLTRLIDAEHKAVETTAFDLQFAH
jgi:hypothetical protein